MIDILAFGDAVIDMQVHIQPDDLAALDLQSGLSHIVDESKMQQLIQGNSQILMYSGGSAANTIYTSSSLGSQCALAGNIGQDALAQQFQLGSSKHYSLTKTQQTTRCLVFIEPNGDRTFAAYLPNDRKDQKFQAPQAKFSLIEGYMLYNYSYHNLQPHLSGSIVLTLSDCNLINSKREEMNQWVAASDIIIGNEQEFLALTQVSSIKECLSKQSMQEKIVTLTRSSKGCIIQNKQAQQYAVEAVKTNNVLNSNGAGDSFAGAFLHSYCHNGDLIQAAHKGAYAGSLAVQQDSARLPLAVIEEHLS